MEVRDVHESQDAEPDKITYNRAIDVMPSNSGGTGVASDEGFGVDVSHPGTGALDDLNPNISDNLDGISVSQTPTMPGFLVNPIAGAPFLTDHEMQQLRDAKVSSVFGGINSEEMQPIMGLMTILARRQSSTTQQKLEQG